MKTLYEKMRANRGRWIKPPIQAAEVSFMVVDGVKYVERKHRSCKGCSFDEGGDCGKAYDKAAAAFGFGCAERGVIYIKVE